MCIAALNKDIAFVSYLQRLASVLLYHQNRNARAGHLDNSVKQFIHHDRTDARGGLIQHQHLRLCHQCAAHGHLLSLPA